MNTIRQADMPDTTSPIAHDDAAPTLATVVRPALPRFVLRGVGGAGFGRTFALVGPTVLGRASDSGIHLDHPGVSRQHVRLTPTGEGLLVEDLGSTNGWLLNEKIQQRAWARHGDEIGIDVLRFRVVATGLPGESAPRARPRAERAWWPWVAVFAVLGACAALLLR
jgi:hypothetical protein